MSSPHRSSGSGEKRVFQDQRPSRRKRPEPQLSLVQTRKVDATAVNIGGKKCVLLCTMYLTYILIFFFRNSIKLLIHWIGLFWISKSTYLFLKSSHCNLFCCFFNFVLPGISGWFTTDRSISSKGEDSAGKLSFTGKYGLFQHGRRHEIRTRHQQEASGWAKTSDWPSFIQWSVWILQKHLHCSHHTWLDKSTVHPSVPGCQTFHLVRQPTADQPFQSFSSCISQEECLLKQAAVNPRLGAQPPGSAAIWRRPAVPPPAVHLKTATVYLQSHD